MAFEDKKLGIYLHVPFCLQKCLYCDFCSFPGYTEEMTDAYVKRLIADIESYSKKVQGEVDTVYFGGGTPTLLSERQFDSILHSLNKSFAISAGAEISCECNPATADFEHLKNIRKIGINRLSVGVQSANDRELRALGRAHSFSDFKDLYNDARRAGFENISVDLMYGIPDQTVASFEKTIDALCDCSPEHISAYCLKIEDGTPFGRKKETLSLPNEDEEYDMYMLCNEKLVEYGYNRYEISNFSRPGYESRHNLKYWTGADYLGFGVAAHSYFDGERFSNSRDISAYIRGEDITEERFKISEKEKIAEYIMLRMRLAAGINCSDFQSRFGVSLFDVVGSLDRYVEAGYIKKDAGCVSFTERGVFVSNTILSDILEFD